jgi:UDPglucose--hexose-1-phosphate uridylyltransferase
MSTESDSHARQNLLTGEWVLVSPHRNTRPWQGQVETADATAEPDYVPDCYLCPGNDRAGGNVNPDYRGSFVFDNDFPALSATSGIDVRSDGLFRSRRETGRCRVVCYTEKHNQRLATMTVDDIAAAIETLIDEFRSLEALDSINYVQIFENRGQMMGCSNQHPHAQIWATENLPGECAKELTRQREWLDKNQSLLLCDYRDAEEADGRRVVHANEHFVAVVPYWATWPFETLVLPRRVFSAPDEMNDDEIRGLAGTLRAVLGAGDAMFSTSAPYSMGFHPRPSDGEDHPEWLFHAHIYPPLLRSATVRKHLVGFEMLGMPQRDLTPELAAATLREYCK